MSEYRDGDTSVQEEEQKWLCSICGTSAVVKNHHPSFVKVLLFSADSVDEICRHIAKESDTAVVSVGYLNISHTLHSYPKPILLSRIVRIVTSSLSPFSGTD